MNNKLVFILAIVCGILTVIIVAEWGYAVHVRKQVLSPLSDSDVKAAPLAEMPSLDLSAQPEESYVDFVERPLFISGRRPVAGGADVLPQAGAEAVGQFDWQLVGVYTNINDQQLQALFARQTSRLPKDNFRKLAEGALLDGWQLTKIEQDKATLNQEGNQKVLFLRKPKPKQSPGDGAPPPNTAQAMPAPEPGAEPVPVPELEEEPLYDEEIMNE